MSSAPKPILIQGKEGGSSENESTTPTEAPPSTPTEPGGSTSASLPKATSNLAQIIERYETLKAKSDPGIPVGIIALIFSVGGPILAASGLGGSTDLEEAANVCCGGLIIGFVLLLVAVSQSQAYQKEVKQAFEAVKAEVNVQKPPTRYSLLVIVSALMGGGFFLAQVGASETSTLLVGVGLILFFSGLLTFATWLQTNASSDNRKTKERILAAAKSKLQHSEEE
jgi:hypothetical protein